VELHGQCSSVNEATGVSPMVMKRGKLTRTSLTHLIVPSMIRVDVQVIQLYDGVTK
jgi:hypothetical protein